MACQGPKPDPRRLSQTGLWKSRLRGRGCEGKDATHRATAPDNGVLRVTPQNIEQCPETLATTKQTSATCRVRTGLRGLATARTTHRATPPATPTRAATDCLRANREILWSQNNIRNEKLQKEVLWAKRWNAM